MHLAKSLELECDKVWTTNLGFLWKYCSRLNLPKQDHSTLKCGAFLSFTNLTTCKQVLVCWKFAIFLRTWEVMQIISFADSGGEAAKRQWVSEEESILK